MFGSEAERAAAELHSALDHWDRTDTELEQLLRARHPETIELADYHVMRSILLKHIESNRALVRALRRAIDGRSNPQGNHRGRN
jgi:hypothetical protein